MPTMSEAPMPSELWTETTMEPEPEQPGGGGSGATAPVLRQNFAETWLWTDIEDAA